MMNTSMILRALANGVNPDTGELLNRASVAQAPEMIRMLFALAEEMVDSPETEKVRKTKLSSHERQQKNIADGKPAKSYFPWSDEEKRQLEDDYTIGKTVEALSLDFGRSKRAVAIQLEKLGMITAEQLMNYQ